MPSSEPSLRVPRPQLGTHANPQLLELPRRSQRYGGRPVRDVADGTPLRVRRWVLPGHGHRSGHARGRSPSPLRVRPQPRRDLRRIPGPVLDPAYLPTASSSETGAVGSLSTAAWRRRALRAAGSSSWRPGPRRLPDRRRWEVADAAHLGCVRRTLRTQN